ncbi:MAG TPA: DUF4159 domain-containing protein, partial [Phycisphaerae bacterium]|nr:DUF4159 domain-containing protein [Phycisphaerae bacterium]
MIHATYKVRLMAVILAGCAIAFGSASTFAQVSSEQVQKSIQKAIATLRASRQANGTWKDYGGYKGGITAISTLALLNAGISPNDPAIRRGVAYLKEVKDEKTYVVSLKCQVFAAADPSGKAHKVSLQQSAAWLIKTQLKTGMWGYGLSRGVTYGRGDNSNTQFALLGLHEAAKAGILVPERVWKLSRVHFFNTQLADGGWTYYYQKTTPRPGVRVGNIPSYGSMTAAGVASLYICGQRLHHGGMKAFVNGAYPSCGKYKQNVVLAKGLEWMGKNFSVKENPGRRTSWLHYYLYGIERVGMVSGMRNFGRHDWYRQGAKFLVDTQSAKGTWGSNYATYDTAFSLLFLAKGIRPVIIQKLQWKGNRSNCWNRNIHDLENFTEFLDTKLGRKTTWQTATLNLSLQDLRVSPVLFITGHEMPDFSKAERVKLKAFVESGGTILAEACCGSQEFRDGFRKLVKSKELWPEYPLKPLPSSHQVWSSHYTINDRYGLEGIEIGCRTGVFFSPNALSALWEMQDYKKGDKAWSEFAFKLGTNIAAYATGRETLANKLDLIDLPDNVDGNKPFEVPRGAVRIARLYHATGDYNADANCLLKLSALLRDEANVDVVAKERHLKTTDKALYDYPVVFMTGHNAFVLSDEEIAALKKYLDKGGFLFADSCCGRKAFDESFRKMVAKLFPEKKFQRLPKNHPIITGQLGKP